MTSLRLTDASDGFVFVRLGNWEAGTLSLVTDNDEIYSTGQKLHLKTVSIAVVSFYPIKKGGKSLPKWFKSAQASSASINMAPRSRGHMEVIILLAWKHDPCSSVLLNLYFLLITAFCPVKSEIKVFPQSLQHCAAVRVAAMGNGKTPNSGF